MVNWWELLRSEYEDGGEQDGVTRVIDGYGHIFGCTRDRRCLQSVDNEEQVICDCPCHNGEPLTVNGLVAQV